VRCSECGADLTAIEIDPIWSRSCAIARRPRRMPTSSRRTRSASTTHRGRGRALVRGRQSALQHRDAADRRLARTSQPPQRIVAMVQRDVADRLTAKPSTPHYGSLTLVRRTIGRRRRARSYARPGVFYPRPKVDSAVVVLERRREPAVACAIRALSAGRARRVRVPPQDARQQPFARARDRTRAHAGGTDALEHRYGDPCGTTRPGRLRLPSPTNWPSEGLEPAVDGVSPSWRRDFVPRRANSFFYVFAGHRQRLRSIRGTRPTRPQLSR
jgi:hypothetical protein